jgi:hypothetical protein
MRLILAALTFTVSPAFAVTDCNDIRGNVAHIDVHPTMGMYLTLSSVEISEFYKQKYGLTVAQLETVVDPETNKFVAEKLQGNDYRFLTHAPSSNNGVVWGVDYKTSRDEALIYVTDMEGKRFSFHMLCKENLPVN